MPVFVFYDFRIIRYHKRVIKQMDASLFEGAMEHGPAFEQRWHRGEGKDSRQRRWIPDRVEDDRGGAGSCEGFGFLFE